MPSGPNAFHLAIGKTASKELIMFIKVRLELYYIFYQAQFLIVRVIFCRLGFRAPVRGLAFRGAGAGHCLQGRRPER